jgi:hypothetical protein
VTPAESAGAVERGEHWWPVALAIVVTAVLHVALPGKYRVNRLGGADVYTLPNAYQLVESLRIDYGRLGPFGIHP